MRPPHILCIVPVRGGPAACSPVAMTDPLDDYAARAAAFRRLAGEPGNEKQRAALLAIAEQYEAVATRLDEDEEAQVQARASQARPP